MADQNPDTRASDGAAIAEQLQGTTSADAGGNVSGTDANNDDGADLDIVFEPESDDEER